ncbi:MAG: hypothetical protein SWY16_05735 [Cyanobacteriota bacterium]|nr:hypothetical protein [Cyanobacteriota bacterium]
MQPKTYLFGAVVLGAVFIAVFATRARKPPMTAATGTPAFEGRALLGVSDADLSATGYATGVLQRAEGKEDALSVTPLPLDANNPGVTELPAPNSVISWPQVLDVSDDGRFAYVVETRGTPPANVEEYENVFQDFPDGTRLSVYDLSDSRDPKLLQQTDVPLNPNTVMVSADGNRLAMASDDTQGEIVVVGLENGLPTAIQSFDLDVAVDRAGRGGIRSIALHPDGTLIAANLLNKQVAFYRIEEDAAGNAIDLKPLDEPIDTGNHLAEIGFSPDGRHALVSDVKWSTLGSGTLSHLFNPRGEMVSIRWGADGAHEITDRATVGFSPEGFDISPQGDLIVTVDMNRTFLPTFFPANIWPRNNYSSLTLLSYNAQEGTFAYLDEYDYEGILPEDAAFDRNGENVAIAIYQYGKGEDGPPENGYIGFWNVDRSGSQPALKQTGYTIPVTRGLHDLVLIP